MDRHVRAFFNKLTVAVATFTLLLLFLRTPQTCLPLLLLRVLSNWRFFDSIHDLGLLRNHSNVLCVSAGAGHKFVALSESGVTHVTEVELINSPPLVSIKLSESHCWHEPNLALS
ncbi:hypothetical protein NL676_017679 [Syzygium grande]|nr:hypothetical protein NL676_017679 [Syzygium grande]